MRVNIKNKKKYLFFHPCRRGGIGPATQQSTSSQTIVYFQILRGRPEAKCENEEKKYSGIRKLFINVKLCFPYEKLYNFFSLPEQ